MLGVFAAAGMGWQSKCGSNLEASPLQHFLFLSPMYLPMAHGMLGVEQGLVTDKTLKLVDSPLGAGRANDEERHMSA